MQIDEKNRTALIVVDHGVGGLGVGRGYFDSEELTAQRFRDDPFVAGAWT